MYVYSYLCVCIYIYIYIYICISIHTHKRRAAWPCTAPRRASGRSLQRGPQLRKGEQSRLETLIELKFLDSSFSSLSSDRNQTSGSQSSSSRRRYLSQQYPPTPLTAHVISSRRAPIARFCNNRSHSATLMCLLIVNITILLYN